MRYDLAFLLCCCKSFLGSEEDDDDDENDEESNGNNNNSNKKEYRDYYKLLGVQRDATQDEIKRAYKRQSLLMHPDKLAQKGVAITTELQTKFTKMKEAYEVLSDPHKRDTYNALGERGVKWLDEPFAIDPATLAHNFAKSSVIDRSKIFAIFVSLAIAVFILPILICFHVDGTFGPNTSWIATLTPLWLWNLFLIFYHSRVILMGPIQRPEHIPIEEWVDPLPMKKRIFSLLRFLLIVVCEILVALKLDHILQIPWFLVLSPLYVWEATTLYKKWPLARMRIVTVDDLEVALGKPFSEFTPAEKELIGQRYSVVSSTSSPDFDAAQKLKQRARNDVLKSVFRIVFVLVLLIQLDGNIDWSWWLVFAPIWIMSLVICCDNYQSYVEVKQMAMEKDPTIFAPQPAGAAAANDTTSGKYGAVGETGGGATTTAAEAAAAGGGTTLTDEEREQLRAHVSASSSKLCNKCCSHGFVLVILFLFVAKLQGAGFSAFWIISPFLFMAAMLLCCIGCAIFGVTEVSTDGINYDATSDFAYMNAAETGTAAPGTAAPPPTTTSSPSANVPPTNATNTANDNNSKVYVPPPLPSEPAAVTVPLIPAPVEATMNSVVNDVAHSTATLDGNSNNGNHPLSETNATEANQPEELKHDASLRGQINELD